MRHAGKPNVVSLDVLRLRLVSKRFDVTALDLWASAVRYGIDNDHHRITLQINPHENNLQDLLDIVTRSESGRILLSVVTHIDVILKPIAIHRELHNYMREYLEIQLAPYRLNFVDASMDHNLREHYKVWKNQRITDKFLQSADGIQRFRSMLAAMSSLRHCSVMARDFWQSGFGRCLPWVPGCDADLTFSSFSLHLLGHLSHNYMMEGLAMSVSESTMMTKNMLFPYRDGSGYENLTTFILDIIHGNDVLDDGMDSSDFCASSLYVHDCLREMHNLKSLCLRYEPLVDLATMWEVDNFSGLGSNE